MSALSPRRLSMGAAAGLLVLLAASGNPAVARPPRHGPLPPPLLVRLPAPVALARPRRRLGQRRASGAAHLRPPQALTTVQSANSSARDYPSAGAYVNAALYYDFEPGGSTHRPHQPAFPDRDLASPRRS